MRPGPDGRSRVHAKVANMTDLTLVTAPTVEPILVDMELRDHLRIDGNDEDYLLDGMIIAARQYMEEATKRAFVTQTWRLTLDNWPTGSVITLPRPPLQSVTDIKYLDEDGVELTWAATNYVVDTDGGRVSLATNKTWPTESLYPVGAIRVTFVAGYGADGDAVPAQIRQGIKMLVGHWYENREGTTTGIINRSIPFAVESIIYLNRAY